MPPGRPSSCRSSSPYAPTCRSGGRRTRPRMLRYGTSGLWPRRSAQLARSSRLLKLCEMSARKSVRSALHPSTVGRRGAWTTSPARSTRLSTIRRTHRPTSKSPGHPYAAAPSTLVTSLRLESTSFSGSARGAWTTKSRSRGQMTWVSRRRGRRHCRRSGKSQHFLCSYSETPLSGRP